MWLESGNNVMHAYLNSAGIPQTEMLCSLGPSGFFGNTFGKKMWVFD